MQEVLPGALKIWHCVNKVLTIEQRGRSSLAFRDDKSKAFELEYLPRQSTIAEIALSLLVKPCKAVVAHVRKCVVRRPVISGSRKLIVKSLKSTPYVT
jgi:hypothetical protein